MKEYGAMYVRRSGNKCLPVGKKEMNVHRLNVSLREKWD